ncbi:AAA family ATPase [Chryseobacterium gwangjuense]|uniref:AAA family ATPase n=1 Tax=Chryseobacterium gwangjuense TaxID=1069980 RepID=UPI001E437B7C|nr:ATP-binding protein [Chryseobacterium gwangjuense]MCE3075829.1 ATP-binding protein [Chryseobacterium gwangjuense]
MNKELNKIDNISKYLIDLVTAGIIGDTRKVEVISLSLARSIRKSDPDVSSSIQNILALNSSAGSSAVRSNGNIPIPTDNDTHLEMARIIKPHSDGGVLPVFNERINMWINDILEERNNLNTLLAFDISPSTNLLLIGQPGTGKTMLAHYIASKLNKNLVIMDLSSSISNLMGKTGHNIKKVLNYAKDTGAVLLLDEFDAIAKKRDDQTDLGEIKRVVNVLLMELEDWPISSMLIATSNHPELLDRAIWRRFDHVIEVPLPSTEEVIKILNQNLLQFLNDDLNNMSILQLLAGLLDGRSAADICKFTNNVKRRIALKDEDLIIASLNELESHSTDKKVRGKFCILAKEMLGKKITVRKLSEMTGLSTAGVQHHISKIK